MYKQIHIPDFVVEAIDKILRGMYSSSLNCRITVKEVVDLIPENLREIAKTDIYDNGWRYYESLYKKRGWNVTFDRPSADESYEANFTFKSA